MSSQSQSDQGVETPEARKARLSIINQLFKKKVNIEVPPEIEEYFVTYLNQSKIMKKINKLLNVNGKPQDILDKFNKMKLKELMEYKKDMEISMPARSGSGKNGTILKSDYIEYFSKDKYHYESKKRMERLLNDSIYSGHYYIEPGIPFYKKLISSAHVRGIRMIESCGVVDEDKIDLMMNHIKSIMINEYNITTDKAYVHMYSKFKSDIIESEKMKHKEKFKNKYKKIQFKQEYYQDNVLPINHPHHWNYKDMRNENAGRYWYQEPNQQKSIKKYKVTKKNKYKKKYLKGVYHEEIVELRKNASYIESRPPYRGMNIRYGKIIDFTLDYLFINNHY